MTMSRAPWRAMKSSAAVRTAAQGHIQRVAGDFSRPKLFQGIGLCIQQPRRAAPPAPALRPVRRSARPAHDQYPMKHRYEDLRADGKLTRHFFAILRSARRFSMIFSVSTSISGMGFGVLAKHQIVTIDHQSRDTGKFLPPVPSDRRAWFCWQRQRH